MLKAEIKLGKVYRVKVNGRLTRVRLDSVSPFGGWQGINLVTGRKVHIRTAAKLRYEIDPASPVGQPAPAAPAYMQPQQWRTWQCPHCNAAARRVTCRRCARTMCEACIQASGLCGLCADEEAKRG